MMAPVSTRPGLATAVAVTRWSRPATVTTVAATLALVVLAALPYLAGTGITQALVTLFLLVSMAALWNLLAGYAGMISFGQQAYLGIGAYLVWLVGKTGVSPFAAIVVAAAGCAVAAVPIFALLRPLTGGYFAVATWVVAECLFLYVTNQLWLGGGTGVGLQQLSSMAPVIRNAYTYWMALALMAVIVAGVYVLVRSRFGLDSRAVHNEPAAAAAMGVEVGRTRWLAYVLAAVGFGAVGARADHQHPVHRPGHRVQRELQRRHAVHGGDRRDRHHGGPGHRRGHLLRRPGGVLLVRGVVPGGHRGGGDRGGAHRAGGPVGDSRPPWLVAAAGRVPGPAARHLPTECPAAGPAAGRPGTHWSRGTTGGDDHG